MSAKYSHTIIIIIVIIIINYSEPVVNWDILLYEDSQRTIFYYLKVRESGGWGRQENNPGDGGRSELQVFKIKDEYKHFVSQDYFS